MEFPGNFKGTQNTANTNYLSGVHSLYEVGQGVSDGTWPTNFKINQSWKGDGTSSYMSKALGAADSRHKFTYSGWIKLTQATATGFVSSVVDEFNRFSMNVTSAGLVDIFDYTSNAVVYRLQSTSLLKDYGSWYHIVYAVDTTQPARTDRAKLYINGQLETLQETSGTNSDGGFPVLNYNNPYVTSTGTHYIATEIKTYNVYHFGYVAEFHRLDGYTLDASYFGFTHPTTKKWLPKRYVGEYGSTGFHLDFAGTTVGTGAVGTIGEDKSGNGNHFTSTNVDFQDVVPDSPTNNFCIFDRHNFSTGSSGTTATLTQGNLIMYGGGNDTGCIGTIAVPPKGHWYMEIRVNDSTFDMMWGGCPVNCFKQVKLGGTITAQWSQVPYGVYSTSYGSPTIGTLLKDADGNQYTSQTSPATSGESTTGDVLGYGFDFENGEIFISKNGTHVYTVENWVPADDYYVFGYQVHSTWPAVNMTVNWGQDPTFNGGEGAGPTNRIYSDANGLGKFLYEPPAGALAICSENIDKIRNQPTTYISDETNKHTITYNSEARISQFSPYIKGGYGISFDGDDDVIDSADHASLSLDGAANNDFTIELWYWFMEEPDSSYYAGIFSKWAGDPDKEFTVQAYSDRTIGGSMSSDASGNYTNFRTTAGLLKGKWNHIAFVGDIATDGDLYCWINGNRVLAKTDFSGYNTSGTKSAGMRIGLYANATYSRAAIISDFRMVSGLMVYDKTATTIDVPTEPLKNISGGSGTDAYTTALLLSANSPRFVDTGANSLALTATSAPKIEDFSPYTTREPSMGHPAINVPERDLSIAGGSFVLDGDTYLTIPTSGTDLAMGGGPFTVECWVYVTGLASNDYHQIIDFRDSGTGGTADEFSILVEGSSGTAGRVYAIMNSTAQHFFGGLILKEGTWNHIALVRSNTSSGGVQMYLNGTPGTSTETNSNTLAAPNNVYIGRYNQNANYNLYGYVTDVRVVKGKAVYTGAFTPPTAPLAQTSKTKLLLQPYSKVKQSGSVYKNSHRYTRDEIGDAVNRDRNVTHIGRLFHGKVISDTSPYSKGDDIGSFVFDGLDDWVKIPKIPAVGTSDFTVEMWFKELIDSNETYDGIFNLYSPSTSKRFQVAVHNGSVHVYTNNGSWNNLSWSPTYNTWHHLAFVRDYSATSLKLYVDGTQVFSSGTLGSTNHDEDWDGGDHGLGEHNGYNNIHLTDFRVTKQALYTGAFTTPKYPLSTTKYVTDGTDQSATGPSTTTTYTVTVASGTKYDGTTGNRYLIDGEPFDTVTLHRGSTYRFDVSDSSFGSNAHPFRFSSNENNSPSAAYTTGVTTSGDGGSAGAYVEIVVANDAPDNLYYYCTNHSGMGGTIKVEGGRTITAGNALMLLQPGKKEQKSEVFELASMNRLNYSSADTNVANNGYSVTSTTAQSVHSSFSVSSGKWYVECAGLSAYMGVQEANTASPIPTYNASINSNNSQAVAFWSKNSRIFGGNGTSTISSILVSGTETDIADTDVMAMAIDMDASPKTVQWLKNNTRLITVKLGSTDYIASDGTTGTATATFADISNLYVTYNGGESATNTADFNFGQDPTMGGHITPSGGTNADNGFPDEDGRGSFRYAPPAGYKAIGRFQKPAQVVSDAAQHPEKHFNTILYQGTASGTAITGLDFKPDFVWVKNRSNSTGYHHAVYDSVRGVNKTLRTSSNGNEIASTAQLMSFDDGGFTVGDNSDSGNYVNLAGDDYVAWCWKAGDEITPNTKGTNPSNVSVNKDAGFSIVSWVSSGGTTSSNYIGHGLDETPEVILIKDRDASPAENWHYYSNVVDNTHDYYFLDTTAAKADSSYTAPTSDYFYWASNEDSPYIAYCWHSVPGYSKIGKYVGNGNADGPFINLGFKPAWVMIKTTGTNSWCILDNKRDTINPVDRYLLADDTGAEGTSGLSTDFLSNGFKPRTTSAAVNGSGVTFIYMAFAEAPFTRTSAK